MNNLLHQYSKKYEEVMRQMKLKPEEGGDLRESFIVESINWINWHLHSVIYPSMIEIDNLLIAHFQSFSKKEEIRQFILLQTRILTGPSIHSVLKSRQDISFKEPPGDLKVTQENELKLKELQLQIIELLINSV